MTVLDVTLADSDLALAKPAGWSTQRTRLVGLPVASVRGALLACDAASVALATVLAGLSLPIALGFAATNLLVLTIRPIKLAPMVIAGLPQLLPRAAMAAIAAELLLTNHGGGGSFLRAELITLVTVLVGRAFAYRCVRVLRSRGHGLEPVVIVGSGVVAAQMATLLTEHPEYGLAPAGFVDSTSDSDVPLLGELRDLGSVLARVGARRVVVAYSGHRDSALADVLRDCLHLKVQVYLVPRFFELGIPIDGRWADEVWGVPLSRMGQSALRTVRYKRAFDLVVALVGVLIAAPLLLLCAAAVRLSSPGPVLFRQRRVGMGGREFDVLKFRSMRVNDDSGTTWTVAGDDRRTPFGRFLRNTSLDELPQLFNVVRGDMSIVGPRPERPYYVERFSEEIPQYRHRHRVPPGITGLAQVNGLRGDTSIPERTRYDNRYIDDWSLWRDVSIILGTAKTFLPGQSR